MNDELIKALHKWMEGVNESIDVLHKRIDTLEKFIYPLSKKDANSNVRHGTNF